MSYTDEYKPNSICTTNVRYDVEIIIDYKKYYTGKSKWQF